MRIVFKMESDGYCAKPGETVVQIQHGMEFKDWNSIFWKTISVFLVRNDFGLNKEMIFEPVDKEVMQAIKSGRWTQ